MSKIGVWNGIGFHWRLGVTVALFVMLFACSVRVFLDQKYISELHDSYQITTLDTTSATMTPSKHDTVGAHVDRFAAFVRNNSDTGIIEPGHRYASRGVRYLAGALQAIAKREHRTDLVARCDTLAGLADSLQSDSSSINHPDISRRAFIIAADMIVTAASTGSPLDTGTVVRVSEAAEAIDPGKSLLDQRAEVMEFFNHADTALENVIHEEG